MTDLHRLDALRARDGGLRWQYPADVTSHPVVAGGMLYTLGVKGGGTGGGSTTVPCLRIRRDGQEEWMYESLDIIDYLRNKRVA